MDPICLTIVSVQVLYFEILSCQRGGIQSFQLLKVVWWVVVVGWCSVWLQCQPRSFPLSMNVEMDLGPDLELDNTEKGLSPLCNFWLCKSLGNLFLILWLNNICKDPVNLTFLTCQHHRQHRSWSWLSLLWTFPALESTWRDLQTIHLWKPEPWLLIIFVIINDRNILSNDHKEEENFAQFYVE